VNKVDVWALLLEPPVNCGPHVVVAGNVGPVFGEHPPAPRVDLHLPDGGDPGPFKA